jgi:hypothetical protein
VGAAGIETAMRAAFEEAEVDAAEVEHLEPAMTTEAKDDTSSPPPSPRTQS